MKETFRMLGSVIISALIVALVTSMTGLSFGFYYLLRWVLGELNFSSHQSDVVSWCIIVAVMFLFGAVMVISDENKSKEKIEKEAKKKNLAIAVAKEAELEKERASFRLYQIQAEQENELKRSRLLKQEEKIKKDTDDFYKIAYSETQNYPWLAKVVADFFYIRDRSAGGYLDRKKHPAHTAAEQVRAIAAEKKELTYKCKMYEYQLNYYETLFPWLEEFKAVNPKDGARYAEITSGSDREAYDTLKDWLSPEEYLKLPVAQKNQLALDRYKKRKKSDWDIGIEYERYVGYLYEQKGYKVHYHGAVLGLCDMGRDLIAEKDDVVTIIQCKRWAKVKEIHEKHIFQLYGSTVLMSVESKKKYQPLFITTTKLSDTAKKCADFLGVAYKENFQHKEHPLVKCNISQDGEKIYHLPFDQQYDKVQIFGKAGAQYVVTAKEAEELGFRHAYKWRPQLNVTG